MLRRRNAAADNSWDRTEGCVHRTSPCHKYSRDQCSGFRPRLSCTGAEPNTRRSTSTESEAMSPPPTPREQGILAKTPSEKELVEFSPRGRCAHGVQSSCRGPEPEIEQFAGHDFCFQFFFHDRLDVLSCLLKNFPYSLLLLRSGFELSFTDVAFCLWVISSIVSLIFQNVSSSVFLDYRDSFSDSNAVVIFLIVSSVCALARDALRKIGSTRICVSRDSRPSKVSTETSRASANFTNESRDGARWPVSKCDTEAAAIRARFPSSAWVRLRVSRSFLRFSASFSGAGSLTIVLDISTPPYILAIP